jgi:AcrR family transcriptional regulator
VNITPLTFSGGYLPFGKLMAQPRSKSGPGAREQIMRAAVRRFANSGYAGASVQAIVDEARVTKPVLYYHFGSKEGLYRALIEQASEERFRRSEAAVARGGTLAEKFTEIVAATFEFVRQNRELTQMSFASLFAAKGAVPDQNHCMKKGRRVFDLMQNLAEAGRRQGVLKREFCAAELTIGIYGMMNFHVMLHLVIPGEVPLNRELAVRIVKLFLSGGAPEGRTPAGKSRR